MKQFSVVLNVTARQEVHVSANSYDEATDKALDKLHLRECVITDVGISSIEDVTEIYQHG